jgi:pimeloyl-ACP methyl ester carboxylesterase
MLSRREVLALSAAAAVPTTFPDLVWAFADDTDPTRVFTGDKKPTDVRLGKPRTLDDYAPFVVPKTKEAWEARRKQLREQMLVASGLWPLPEKTPLNAVVHGKIEKEGYTIEKVYFASMPGHYVCGNLYRPSIRYSNPSPGVLFAHGHWAGGRFHDDGEKAAKASVDAKGEPDMDRGRYFMQALPATLAKLGFVVFHYDMIGYSDSTAIPHREGFKDAEAELRLQSFMGLQTWNSVRSLDFLASLPDVDAKRLGMTGASGGGTQTFMLAAIDDRLASAFPAVMVSTGMQGGCVCENCSLLRVNTGNVEIAGLFAPKPMACSAANDWTKEMMTKGYPELQQLYDLYGAKGKVAVRAWLEYGHQYNVHARQMMYAWFLKHLAGKDEEVKEEAFKPVTPTKDLSVFDDKHPRPKDELNAPKLREVMTKSSDEQMAKLAPKDAESLKEFKRVVGTALRVMVNDELPKDFEYRVHVEEIKVDGHDVIRTVLGRKGEKDGVPCVGVIGPNRQFDDGRVVFWLHPKGKASLIDNGKVVPTVKTLIAAGFAVFAPDLLGTGENSFPKPFPVDKGFAGYTYGYNRSLLANRVHDVLTLIAFGKGSPKAKANHLVGWGEFGAIAILAKALAGDAVAKTAADLNQFRFETIKDTADPMMLPGAAKYGGLPAFLALCAPGKVFVHNHRGTASGRLPRAAYEAAGAADNLTRATEKVDDAKVVEWLVK